MASTGRFKRTLFECRTHLLLAIAGKLMGILGGRVAARVQDWTTPLVHTSRDPEAVARFPLREISRPDAKPHSRRSLAAQR